MQNTAETGANQYGYENPQFIGLTPDELVNKFAEAYRDAEAAKRQFGYQSEQHQAALNKSNPYAREIMMTQSPETLQKLHTVKDAIESENK